MVSKKNKLDFASEEIKTKYINNCKKLIKERNNDLEIELDMLLPNPH